MDPLELLLASHELLPVGDRGLLVEHGQDIRGRIDGAGGKFVGVLDRVDGTLRLDAATQETDDQRSFWLQTNVSALHRHTDDGKLQAQQLACAKALVDVLVEQKALRKAFEPHLAAVCARDVPGAVAMGLNADGHLPLIERVFKKICAAPAPAAAVKVPTAKPAAAAASTSAEAKPVVKTEVKTEPEAESAAPEQKVKRAKKEKLRLLYEDGVFYVASAVSCMRLDDVARESLQEWWHKRRSPKTAGLELECDAKQWPLFVGDLERLLTA